MAETKIQDGKIIKVFEVVVECGFYKSQTGTCKGRAVAHFIVERVMSDVARGKVKCPICQNKKTVELSLVDRDDIQTDNSCAWKELKMESKEIEYKEALMEIFNEANQTLDATMPDEHAWMVANKIYRIANGVLDIR